MTKVSVQLPEPSTGNWDWQLRADCRHANRDLFFSREGEGHGARLRREHSAKKFCKPCPVRRQCLEHALTTGEPFGVWGGTTELERRAGTARSPWEPSARPALRVRAHAVSPGCARQSASNTV